MTAFIGEYRDDYGVVPNCRVLLIAPSTYHARVAQRRDPARQSARAQRDAALKPDVVRVSAENFGVYGVRNAITRTIITLPEELRRSLTWDRGAEMAQHARLKVDPGVQVYFCDPQSPWQRGTNENTNGLLCQYFRKGTDLSTHSADTLAAVAATLNGRPRKSLGWNTTAEALDRCLAQIDKQRVATTG